MKTIKLLVTIITLITCVNYAYPSLTPYQNMRCEDTSGPYDIVNDCSGTNCDEGICTRYVAEDRQECVPQYLSTCFRHTTILSTWTRRQEITSCSGVTPYCQCKEADYMLIEGTQVSIQYYQCV